MDKIEKIRAEIERRLKDYWKICFHDVKAYNEDSNVRELKELLSFLDTLSEEPVCLYDGGTPNKQKCGDCTIACSVKVEEELDKDLKEAAERFANTQNKNFLNPEIVKNIFIAGSKWKEDQLMNEVVEGIARPDDCEIWVNLVGYGYKFNDGDFVKLIIIKDDGKSD